MVFAAMKLRMMKELESPTVIMVITHISVMSSLVKTKCPACEPGTGKDFEIIIHHLAVIHTDSVYQSESQLLSDLKAPRGWFPDQSVRSAVLIAKDGQG